MGYPVLKKLCSTSTEEMNKAFNLIFEKYRYLVYYVSFETCEKVKMVTEHNDKAQDNLLRK